MEAAGVVAANNQPREYSCCYVFSRDPMAARYPYACLFLFASFLACLEAFSMQAEGVLRISMTFFLFYAFMSLTTMFAKSLEDIRSIWHTKFWVFKGVLLFALALVTSTLIPTDWVQLYGEISPVGAGICISSIQQISVIRYITRLNNKWCQTNFEQRSAEVVMVSTIAYSACMVGGIFMIIWYAHTRFNIVAICATLVLVCLMPLIALMSNQAKGRYLEPALVGLYILFLCWSALRSEPEASGYRKEKAIIVEKWKTMISVVFGLVSIAVEAFTTGSDYKSVQFGNVAAEDGTPPYGYGHFHVVFALGSMYIGMVLVGWDTHHIVGKWNVDVRWLCMLVHIVIETLVVVSFGKC